MNQTEHRLSLDTIKLTGFKSFVDATTIPLPSNQVAIVGPNGCGKSNIIDAVRWVLGEGSAKNLRGESMADVIFNGSINRKPLGKASVELVFNNPHGALGGAYAHYSKIAIRREVTRDGQSVYYLNNSRCRRRDIVDIFLGTGLGPRSYAIISQGTISRLIEAKPEELRVFLEEAAGISKYKERRRETETRINHTRENLDRLTDLREELGKQIEHLQRQAEAAERYKALKEQERRLRAELLGLRWQLWANHSEKLAIRIRDEDVRLQSLVADLRHLDAAIEKQRDDHVERNDALNDIQAAYYQAGGDVARLEQALQHQRQRAVQLQEDLQQAERALAEANGQLAEDEARLAHLTTELAALAPEAELAKLGLDKAREDLQNAEQSMQHWQHQWDDFNQQSSQASSEAQVQQTRIQHLERAMQAVQQRVEQLQKEEVTLKESLQRENTDVLTTEIAQIVVSEDTAKQALAAAIEQLSHQRQRVSEQQTGLNKSRQELQQLVGQFASQEVLQQAALGQQNQGIKGWLERHNLNKNNRLGEQVQVETGWEKATETVLGNYLQAICMTDFTDLVAALADFNKGNIALFATDREAQQAKAVTGADLLINKITAHCGVDSLLAGIYTAEDLASALAKRDKLQLHESIITRDGIWVGKNWLRVARDNDEKTGVLQRQQTLKNLTASIEQQKQLIASLEAGLQEAQSLLEHTEKSREGCQQKVGDVTRSLADMRAQLRVKEGRAEHMQQRLLQINREISDQEKRSSEADVDLQDARVKWQTALSAMEKHADRRSTLLLDKNRCQENVDSARKTLQIQRDQSHQLSLKKQTLHTELQTKQQHQIRLQQQITHCQKRFDEISAAASVSETPIATTQAELELALNARLVAENELTTARKTLQELEYQLREQEHARSEVEKTILALRSELEQTKLQHQELEIRQKTVIEQLQEADEALEVVLKNLPADANEEGWERKLQSTTHKIMQLGAINLAAIDEYTSQSERKTYLDAQHEDLLSALNTLEEAIRKIDRETRQRFKDTYDQVNNSFGALFPKIFGGGTASLVLTDADLLETGVTVMAQPPGKRNSTIHLLSGGEKALTAIALVFAIFKLTPSPFCMLDEVDAPLDDSNVVRFCNLVKEMAKEVQFIFISHNKVAIEMAEHLAGVTMKEPGVSRMVSVNMEEAIALAEVE